MVGERVGSVSAEGLAIRRENVEVCGEGGGE